MHSGAKKIDREIPWIACGPGVREDFVITDPLSTMDTAATALYALGLPIPTEIEGKPRTDIFAEPPGDAAFEVARPRQPPPKPLKPARPIEPERAAPMPMPRPAPPTTAPPCRIVWLAPMLPCMLTMCPSARDARTEIWPNDAGDRGARIATA